MQNKGFKGFGQNFFLNYPLGGANQAFSRRCLQIADGSAKPRAGRVVAAAMRAFARAQAQCGVSASGMDDIFAQARVRHGLRMDLVVDVTN